MMRNPFLLDRPAIISFSGGRTSAYMLRRIIDAFGGTLPDDVIPVFNNTGKERPETLDFVKAIGERWNVKIRWLEYRNEPIMRRRKGKADGVYEDYQGWRHYFKEVDYAMASRNGSPFDMVIRSRQILPNQAVRHCTSEMKIKTTYRFVRDRLKWEVYVNAIGLRADEPHRVAKLFSKAQTRTVQTLFGDEDEVIGYDARHSPGEDPDVPLAKANVTLDDVMAFWREQRGGQSLVEWLALPPTERQGFDLALRQDEGNCDLCFLKGVQKRLAIMRDRPDLAEWWIEKERLFAGKTRLFEASRFSKSAPSYAELLDISRRSELPLWEEQDELPCNCTD